MRKLPLLTLAATLLAGAPISTTLAVVTPADQFDVEVDGFNSTTGYSAEAVAPLSVTFGTTETFPDAGFNGYSVTVSSSETVNAATNTTTDTVTVSTPDNFIPAPFVLNSNPQQTANGVEFDIGINRTAGGTLDFITPLSPGSTTLSDEYNLSALSATSPGTIVPTFSNGDSSLQSISYIYTQNGSAISAYGVNSYTLTISYPTIIPEPSTYVQAGLGALALGSVLWLRNRRRAARSL